MSRLENDEIVEVLLVNSDEEEAALIVHAMKSAHFANRIKTVSNGKEAIHFLHSVKHNYPRLILIGHVSADHTFDQTVNEIKSDMKLHTIPMVVLCNEVKSKTKGVAFLPRPFSFELFMEKVSEIGFHWVIITAPVTPN
jgi:hypothetical protein